MIKVAQQKRNYYFSHMIKDEEKRRVRVNMSISRELVGDLDSMAKKDGVSRSRKVEKLIKNNKK